MAHVRIVCMSDTHLRPGEGFVVPDGDVLIHAGDLTGRGSIPEIDAACRWIAKLPHAEKVVIAGNHDFAFERGPDAAKLVRAWGLTYLQDTEVRLASGLRVYGSPWTPRFFDWAFNLDRRGMELARRWAAVPTGIDVLVTHGPPFEILDTTKYGARVGCELLAREMARISPRLHVFGHIHESYGLVDRKVGTRETAFVNASICDLSYAPVHPPIVIDLET